MGSRSDSTFPLSYEVKQNMIWNNRSVCTNNTIRSSYDLYVQQRCGKEEYYPTVHKTRHDSGWKSGKLCTNNSS